MRTWLFWLAMLLGCAAPTEGRADLSWITLTTERGEDIKALLGRPAGEGRRAAVIYNHGTEIRQHGYSDAGENTDVKGFVQALVAEGYVALAPIRSFENGTAIMARGRPSGSPESWDGAIEGGLRTLVVARRYLAEQDFIRPDAIGLLSFSEGGNISMWALLGGAEYRAAALLSPAAISPSNRYRLMLAANDERLTSLALPMFIAVAQDDIPPVRQTLTGVLAPRLAKSNPGFVFRDDYPGGHSTFWRVRQDFWNDVSAFLRAHLR